MTKDLQFSFKVTIKTGTAVCFHLVSGQFQSTGLLASHCRADQLPMIGSGQSSGLNHLSHLTAACPT